MRKILLRLLALVLIGTALLPCLTPSVSAASGFTDIKNHWGRGYIETAYEYGIINGVSATSFAPNMSVSRAMFVTMLYRIAGKPAVSLTTEDENGETVPKAYFLDLKSGSYYVKPAIWAYENHIANGKGNGRFAPDDPVTREQMCVFLHRFAALMEQPLPETAAPVTFSDDSRISGYARESVYLLQRSGLVKGVGGDRFAPLAAMTRAEAATLLVRYLQLAGVIPPVVENLVNPAQVISYEQMMEDLGELAASYPDLIRVSSAGTSYEGRDIPLVEFGKGDKYIYTQANIHAREHLSTNFLLEVLDQYAYAYMTRGSYHGYDVRTLLDTYTIVMLPRVNPDGTNIAQNGYDAAGNPAAVKAMQGASRGCAQWKANAQGTDLNRNFPCDWNPTQDVTRPASEGYGGPSAASAPETRAVLQAMEKYNYVCYLDIHMAGNVIYYCNPGIDLAFFNTSKAFAQRISAVTGYRLVNSDPISKDHSAAGYTRHTYRVPSLTVELWPTTVFPSDASRFNDYLWKHVKDLYLETMVYFDN